MIIKNNNTFHLQGKDISYILIVNECGDLIHYYYGKKLNDRDYSLYDEKTRCPWGAYDESGLSLETKQQEFPAYGYTDLRSPAYSVQNKFGNKVSRLLYKDFKIKSGETATIKGMPSIFKGNENPSTLEITLADESIGLEVFLSYTVFEEYNVILRNSKFTNKSGEQMTIESAYSANLDLGKKDMDLIYFPGAWAREREFKRTPIEMGEKLEISNARGGSGHIMNPFVMVCDKSATEKNGDVYGFSLVYSGNHSTVTEKDTYGNIRVMQGINPAGFEIELDENEEFYTPQCVIDYSDKGFGGLSRDLHNLFRNNICKSKRAYTDRPILINNWEGTYFDFTEEKLLAIAKKAKETGVELFVLDDGWFGKRNDDFSSLGDWFVNYDKLPSGIDGLAKKINDEGLEFGLWFEPEMINPDSDLYRAHPDWAISVPNITPTQSRNQYVLDLANDEVCDYVIKSVADILESANISYVKWDYNRPMTDMPFKGYNHKYTLGFYKIMDALIEKFPNVLFEGCSGGGGRFDLGILAYSPQIWTSDNSDAISRLKIQYSTSMCYPISSISAHVTASPNHQVGRATPLKTRADVAYAGIFGYELDITKMEDTEIESVKEQIEFYKKIRSLVRTGDFYRLQSPYEGNYCTWQIVSKDKTETVVIGCRVLSMANFKDENVLLDGLNPEFEYINTEDGNTYGGDELMYYGIKPEYENYDFATFVKHYKIK